MKIYLGADHGGFALKKTIFEWLKEKDLMVNDVGAEKLLMDDDFVDYGLDVAEMVVSEPGSKGILFCRNGFGMSIVANKVAGIRCGLGFDVEATKKGRSDDDINCLAIPADYLDEGKVKGIILAFLETEFSNEEKYKRRLYKMELLTEEAGGCCGGGCGGDEGGCCGGGCGHEH